MAEDRPMRAASDARGSLLWGPLTRFALVIVVATAAVDQAAKLWLLHAVDLPARGIVRLTPFLDLVLTWNTGISWGLFRQEGPLGQGALLAEQAPADAGVPRQHQVEEGGEPHDAARREIGRASCRERV